MKIKKTLVAFSIAMSAVSLHASEVEVEVEVLHWWTSGGEAKSVDALKVMLESKGYAWQDFAVAGGGGESAMTILKTRAISGNPPAAAQIKGHDIQEWAKLGFLTNLNDVAERGEWDANIDPVISNIMKWDGDYVAVPVNVHRVNWLWVNPSVFRNVGVKIPTTLAEFFVVADKIKSAGYLPLAHGGQPWQDATLFEAVALSVLGSNNYERAFVQLDLDFIASEEMVNVFTQFKRMQQYVDDNAKGRDWSTGTSMVIEGDAAMQIMGDWAKGEFASAGKRPGIDYVCVSFPGTAGQFTYNIDSFALFELKGQASIEAQQALAETIMDKEFQEVFNLNKGSIPVRLDMDMSKFDQCALDSMNAFRASAKSGDLVPSISQGMATTSYVQGAIYDVVTNFFNDPDADPKKAAQRLAKAVKSAL